MMTNNFNGQNGVATSAVKYNVVVRNYAENFNTHDEVIDDVVMMMKKYPSDAIYVNDKGIRFEMGIDGKWSVVLRDENMNVIAGFVLGKIKRGLRNAVAHVLGYIEVNEENDEVDMENLVLGACGFNEYMEGKLVEDFKSELEKIKEDAEDFEDSENEHYCGDFNYEYDIEQEWIDFAGGFGVGGDDAYNFYIENIEIFVDEDDLCQWVYEFEETYGVGIDDNCCGSCLVYVKNPYYVAENVAKNDAPCLDGYDIDRGIERVVDTIEKYLGSYTPSYLDQFGDCCICIGWDNFNEDDMMMLIEDGIFDVSVRDTLYEKGTIVELSGFLVYDDGVYVTVDYDRMFNKIA